jgi:hypothetical protein
MVEKKEGEQKASATAIQSSEQLRLWLAELETKIEDLRIQYEQFFGGTVARPPERFHQSVQRELRELQKAPFKGSALGFKARSVSTRFVTLSTYWKRTLRDRENGVYAKDVFKADLRAVHKHEDQRRGTAVGKAEKSLKELYYSYREALEKSSGHKSTLNFENFQRSINQRAREIKRTSGAHSLSFTIVTKDGKVTVQIAASN